MSTFESNTSNGSSQDYPSFLRKKSQVQGDAVLSPFAGVGSEIFMAVKMGRQESGACGRSGTDTVRP